jgi:hypothetical protein
LRVRECPAWFQDALTRHGGVNPYGEPVFRLKWEKCWVLYVWEPREMQGSYEMWLRDYRHEDGSIQFPYPKSGSYRVLQKFIHREVISHHVVEQYVDPRTFEIRETVISKPEVVTKRMEPCGLMLDLMLPMLMAWRKLSDSAKIGALRQEERLKKEEFLAKVKDCREGHRIRRGSQLVQKKAEIIEKGFRQAMAMAAQTGLGMRMEG